MSSRINPYQIDTTPGASCWAAPPAGTDNYLDWLREAYATRLDVGQNLLIVARRFGMAGVDIRISGPHAAEIEAVLKKLHAR